MFLRAEKSASAFRAARHLTEGHVTVTGGFTRHAQHAFAEDVSCDLRSSPANAGCLTHQESHSRRIRVIGLVLGPRRGGYPLDDDGYIAITEFDVPEGQEALAKRGARACPERVIEVIKR